MEHIGKRLVSWASVLEDGTRDQALATSRLPFVFPHVALMPDAHLGRGATVGSVIPTLRALVPAAVPVSAGVYNTSVEGTAVARVAELETDATAAGFDPGRYAGTWARQMGTLGSGNHFIEVTADETGRVWLFLHSGSRGVGNKIAMHHIGVAQHQAEKWWIPLPHEDLACLVEDTGEFWAYVRELRWAQRFALLNREEMMDRVVACAERWTGRPVGETERINCHHNFTEREHHFGKDVWVSRKGAIRARAGEAGLVPGSMGTASYVVSGLGDPVSLHSSPHGAGRMFSRSRARAQFTQDDLRTAMAGIEYRDTDAFVDEIPAAYKDIDQVMADAADLVEVRHVLHQLVNVKGD